MLLGAAKLGSAAFLSLFAWSCTWTSPCASSLCLCIITLTGSLIVLSISAVSVDLRESKLSLLSDVISCPSQCLLSSGVCLWLIFFLSQEMSLWWRCRERHCANNCYQKPVLCYQRNVALHFIFCHRHPQSTNVQIQHRKPDTTASFLIGSEITHALFPAICP